VILKRKWPSCNRVQVWHLGTLQQNALLGRQLLQQCGLTDVRQEVVGQLEVANVCRVAQWYDVGAAGNVDRQQQSQRVVVLHGHRRI